MNTRLLFGLLCLTPTLCFGALSTDTSYFLNVEALTNVVARSAVSGLTGVFTNSITLNGDTRTAWPAGATAGTVINTGASTVGAVPAYTDTTGTNVAPSTVKIGSNGGVTITNAAPTEVGLTINGANGQTADPLMVKSGGTNLFLLDADSSLIMGRFPRPGYPSAAIYRKTDVAWGDPDFQDLFLEAWQDSSDVAKKWASLDIGLSVASDFPGAFFDLSYRTNLVQNTVYMSANKDQLGISLERSAVPLMYLSPDASIASLGAVNPHYYFDTALPLASGHLAKFLNNGTNKLSIAWDGALDSSSSIKGNSGAFTNGITAGASTFTKSVAYTPVTLTDAATVATDASQGVHFRVTLGGNRTLGNPTNPSDGQRMVWEVIQDATGVRTLAMDTKFAFGTDITGITLTTNATKRDFITAVYNSTADKFYVTGFVRGY